jgi:hypothetical protein
VRGGAGCYTAAMFKTIEAQVDEQGRIRPAESLRLPPGSRVLITVLDRGPGETALLSEPALATDWNRPEEDEAWSLLAAG